VRLLCRTARTNTRREPASASFYSGIWLFLCTISVCVNAAQSDVIPFNIPAGKASKALVEFGKQADLFVQYDYSIEAQITHAILGLMDPKTALSQLLVGTGLTYQFTDEYTVVVTRASGSSLERKSAVGQAKARGTPTKTVDGNTELEEVLVTGSHIRGDTVVAGSKVSVITAEEMFVSGANNAADALSSVPQTFGGGPTQDTRQIGVETRANSGFGVGVNLRGLDARATLVLLNGRRVAASGSDGSFGDVLNIPSSAIDRVEILPDSASAMYGTDAVAGVVNYKMKDGSAGTETQANFGTVTSGHQQNYRISQTFGRKWSSGNFFAAVEAGGRDALAAADRPQAHSDLRPGGPNLDTPFSNPATLVTGRGTVAIPRGQNGSGFNPNGLVPVGVNLSDQYEDVDITPRQKYHGLFATAAQELGELVTVSGALSWTERVARERRGGQRLAFAVPGSNAFLERSAAAAAPYTVEYNFGKDFGPQRTQVDVHTLNAAMSIEAPLPMKWKLTSFAADVRETEYQRTSGVVALAALPSALADSDPKSAFDPFGDGSFTNSDTLASMESHPSFAMRSELHDLGAMAEGPIGSFPAGSARVAVGLEYLDQFFRTEFSDQEAASYVGNDLRRRAEAAFVEWKIPLFGPPNSRVGLRALAVSAAARYEHYSDFAHAWAPRVGADWSPMDGLKLRGMWARASRAPTLGDLNESGNVSFRTELPSSVGGSSKVLVWSGNNADLSAETAVTRTAGIAYSTSSLPVFRADVRYFNTSFTHRIQSAVFSQDLLTNPQFEERVTANPGTALRQRICGSTLFAGSAQSDCLLAEIDDVVDIRSRNVASVRTDGLDFGMSLDDDESPHKFGVTVTGTYILDFGQQLTAHASTVSLLNTQNHPINLQMSGTVRWENRNVFAAVKIRHSNSYRDTASEPARPIASWTTIDAQCVFRLHSSVGGWLDNIDLRVGVENVFDRPPPFLVNRVAALGYDQENGDLTGRVISVGIRKKW
jgi:iron complex outermembrane recepter protein